MGNEPSEKEKNMAEKIVSGDGSTENACNLSCGGVSCSGTLECNLKAN